MTTPAEALAARQRAWREERAAEQRAEQARIYADAGAQVNEPDPGPPTAYRPPTAVERMTLLGGPENASRYASDPGIPLEPVAVVTLAELDAQREQIAARNVPGVPYREPAARPLQRDVSVARPASAQIREWEADGSTWA